MQTYPLISAINIKTCSCRKQSRDHNIIIIIIMWLRENNTLLQSDFLGI